MRIPDNRISRLFIKREYLSKLPEPDRSISKKEVRKVLGVSVAILVIIIELSIIFDLYSKLYYGLIGYGSLMDEPVNGLRSVEAEMEEVFSLDEPSTDWNWLCISHENGLPVPNCSTVFGGSKVKIPLSEIYINSAGYRGNFYPEEKTNDTYRIVVLGDSFAFGWGVNNSDVFPQVLEELLNENPIHNEDKTITYEMINFAVPGYNTNDELGILKETGLDYDPDLLIIAFNANDDENNTRIGEIQSTNCNGMEELLENMTLHQRFFFCLIHSMDIFRAEYEKIEPGLRWKVVSEPLDEIKELSIEYGFDVLIFDWTTTRFQKEMLFRSCATFGWYFVDTSEIGSKYPNNLLVLHQQDSHPSALWHRKVAEKIYTEFFENDLNG